MLKMASQIENIVNTYKTLSKIPSISGGKLNKAGNKITAKWSVRNLDKGKMTKYTTSYILDESLKVVNQTDFGSDISTELLSAVSPLETYMAIIREEKNGKDAKKQYLEVWKQTTLAHCIDLTALDLHGDVYADSEFGSLDWAHDETALVYVAERKPPKSEPYIKRKGEDKPKSDGSGETAPKKGEEFLYRQDWGEQLVGKINSVVVVCRLADESVTVLDHLPFGWCPGQVRFAPDGSSVVGVAWETNPRRLGLIFCTNRPSYIFSLALDGSHKIISREKLAVRSPRFSPDGDLVWLQRTSGGPHHACHQLVINKKDSEESSIIIDIVATQKIVENGTFTGLYGLALPSRGFASGRRLVFSTPQETEIKAYVLDLGNGGLTDISVKGGTGSTTVLDVSNDVILASYSNLKTPGQLYVCRLPSKGSEKDIVWSVVSAAIEVPAPLNTSKVEYLHLEQDTSEPVRKFNAIYVSPQVEDGKKLPLVVWPHGGPHSNFVNSFSIEAAFYNMLGFAILRCNFRGSTGSGQLNVLSLLGRVGRIDVSDCHLALTTLIERDGAYPILLYGGSVHQEENGVLSSLMRPSVTAYVIVNGSYGGLVVAHLAAEYPDLFKAMVMRNPLIDLATKGHCADNSDGCAVEAGLEWTEKGPVSEEHLLLLRRCSPLAHVHKVRAPTALMLGSGDKRVPYYQGLEYARRLKANGVETRVYVYEDNHSLSSLPSEMDNLINGADWFLTHIHP